MSPFRPWCNNISSIETVHFLKRPVWVNLCGKLNCDLIQSQFNLPVIKTVSLCNWNHFVPFRPGCIKASLEAIWSGCVHVLFKALCVLCFREPPHTRRTRTSSSVCVRRPRACVSLPTPRRRTPSRRNSSTALRSAILRLFLNMYIEEIPGGHSIITGPE